MIQVMVWHSGTITSHNRAGLKKIIMDNFRRNGWQGRNNWESLRVEHTSCKWKNSSHKPWSRGNFTAGNTVLGSYCHWPGQLIRKALPPQKGVCHSGEESWRNKPAECQSAEMLLDWSLKGVGHLYLFLERTRVVSLVFMWLLKAPGWRQLLGRRLLGKGRNQISRQREIIASVCDIHCSLFFVCSCIPFRPDFQSTELAEKWKWGNTANILWPKVFLCPKPILSSLVL